MLKCKNKEEQKQTIAEIKGFLNGEAKVGTDELNIRYKNVEIDGLGETIEVDVTSETKSLSTEYSSDMAIRDRLGSIHRKYGDKGLKTVIDNIIVAKKILKENGVYKKTKPKEGTKFGGFGGIGIENWILQNGGSFIKSMQTFLENTVDENNKELSFEKFKERYPIYDFGQNHRSGNKQHDSYIEGLTLEGFGKLKELFKEQLEKIGEKNEKNNNFFDSIIEFTEKAEGYKFSDMSTIYSLVAKFKTHEVSKENSDRGEE